MQKVIPNTSKDSLQLNKPNNVDDLSEFTKDDDSMIDESDEKISLPSETEMVIERILGRGSSADVYQGFYKGNQVAIKKFGIHSDMENEHKIMKKISHINVLAIIECIEKESILVLEKLDMNLLEYFQNNNLSFKEKLEICFGCSKGLAYLHQNLIFHGDIKPENFLIELKSKRIVVADFGYSKKLEKSDEKFIFNSGTYQYVSPEIYKDKFGCLASDVYSFACSISFFFSNRVPYSNFNLSMVEVMERVVKKNLRPTLPFQIENLILGKTIICSWSSNYLGRPSMKYLSKFFEQQFFEK